MTTSAVAASPPRCSSGVEFACSLVHAGGVVLSVLALGLLASAAIAHGGGPRELASVCVYGMTLIVLYTASTLYHGVAHAPAKARLRLFDHAAIFLLIAGTYTPFTLISLRGAWGWSLFALVWTLAVAGIALELSGTRRRAMMAVIYVALGWIGLVAIKPLLAHVAPGGLWLLFGGGAAYTIGVPFYLWKTLRFHHLLWHLFVLAGSAMQFFAVFFYVLPRTPA